jgi:hypothetical protein
LFERQSSMQTYRLSLTLRSALLLLLLACLAACGTFEIGIVMPSETRGEDLATTEVITTAEPTATQAPGQTPTPPDHDPWTNRPAFTPVPASEYPAPSRLLVAFVRDDRLWLWEAETREAQSLASTSRTNGEVKISDDGTVIAFLKGNELWAVGSDGKGERRLLIPDDLAAIEPEGPGLSINRLEWVPGTHTLAFNTRLNLAFGLALSDDLHLVDADTLEQRTLLPPGEGGEFYYSLDGSQIAIVTPGEISLIDANGENRRDGALTYTPVNTGSEYQFYAQPAWAPDGSALRVLIPPVSAITRPTEHTTIWHIPADGAPAWMVSSIDAAPLVSADSLAFSPDLEFVAYPQLRQPEGVSPDQAESWLEVLRVANGDRQAYPYANILFRWAPDSRRFAFLADRYEPQLYIGQWSGETVRGSVDPGTPVYDVRWVDAEHYLFVSRRTLASDRVSWDLVLADIHGSSTILASMDSYPHYDLTIISPAAQPEPATTPAPSITATSARTPPTPTPVASFPGLVYWEDNGLWIDLGMEQVRISDRADVSLSPNGTRFVYQGRGEGDPDIWLGDRITASRRNLTSTANRIEWNPRWWPARPGTIIFGSQLQDSAEEPGTGAFLTVVNLDGSGYRVLDEQNQVGCTPAPSPDGETIAYGTGRSAWLFHMDTGPEVFDPADYGLDIDGGLTISSPAWSPDGSKLAWVLVGNLSGDDSLRYGIGVFDLQAQTVEILGSFKSAGGEHCSPPEWSPDGRWLAFEAWAESYDESGLWVAPLEGDAQEARHLGGGQPVWSPDGHWLAFRGRESGHWLVQPGSWHPLALDLSTDVDLEFWIDPFAG